jgi:hypothetical protein
MSERGLLAAFDRGRSAGRNYDQRILNPYRPTAQQDYFEAWNCGWLEENPCYLIVRYPVDNSSPPAGQAASDRT